MIDTGKMLTALAATGIKTIDLPMLTEKLKWDTQIEGCYDLLYKYINVDFPTRQEIEIFVDMTFKTHDSTHFHNGIGCSSSPTVVAVTPKIPMITYLVKSKVPVKAGGKAAQFGAGV